MDNIQKVFVDDSIYTKYSLDDYSIKKILSVVTFLEKGDYQEKYYSPLTSIDFYCPDCCSNSTFLALRNENFLEIEEEIFDVLFQENIIGADFILTKLEKIKEMLQKSDDVFIRKFICARDAKHVACFSFIFKNNFLTKVGQFPSKADISCHDLRDYRKIDDSIAKELKTALGLYSHGIGIGSFVYLRRIIENYFVKSEIDKEIASGVLDSEVYKYRFNKKVDAIKNKLPFFLTENKFIYSILSKGIHSLSEEECLLAFPIVYKSLKYIFDEKIEIERKEKEKIEISRQLKELNKN